MNQVRVKVKARRAARRKPEKTTRQYGRWFRFYAEAMHDPKILALNDAQFRAWVGCLAVAAKNGGKLPSTWHVACDLRMMAPKAQDAINDLIQAQLLDILPDQSIAPHNWSERQFVSDVSTERVRKHRETHRNGDETFQKPFRNGIASVYVSDSETPYPSEDAIQEGGEGSYLGEKGTNATEVVK